MKKLTVSQEFGEDEIGEDQQSEKKDVASNKTTEIEEKKETVAGDENFEMVSDLSNQAIKGSDIADLSNQLSQAIKGSDIAVSNLSNHAIKDEISD